MTRVVPSQVVALIDQMFPGAQGNWDLYPGFESHFMAIIALVEQIPPELITLDGSSYGALVASVEVLRNAVIMRQNRGEVTVKSKVPGYDENAVTVIRRMLSLCTDEYPSPTTLELKFIQDSDLRESLRRDISAVNQALSNGEWKAATVLAGSVVEALLLWALQQRPPADVSAAVSAVVGSKIL